MTRMEPNSQIDDATREQIIGMQLADIKTPKIASLLDIPLPTVYSIIRLYKKRGHANALPRSGRPHKLTERNKKTIILHAEEDRFASCAEIKAKAKSQASTKTIAKVLHNAGLHSRVARSMPFLKPNHISARQEWARENWTGQWKNGRELSGLTRQAWR